MKLSENIGKNMGLDMGMSESIHLTSHIQVRGSVLARFTDYAPGTNTVVAEGILHEKTNLIVNLARKSLAHLVAEGEGVYVVNTFKLGTMGHSGSDILTPVDPTVTDTTLTDPSPFSKVIPTLEYLPVGNETSVKFTIPVEKAEANGAGGAAVAYTEAGLFSTNGNLFARETFEAIVKNANRKVTFEWTLLF